MQQSHQAAFHADTPHHVACAKVHFLRTAAVLDQRSERQFSTLHAYGPTHASPDIYVLFGLICGTNLSSMRGGHVESLHEAIMNQCVYLRFFAFTELLTRTHARQQKTLRGYLGG